jgi:hypothetical protein
MQTKFEHWVIWALLHTRNDIPAPVASEANASSLIEKHK